MSAHAKLCELYCEWRRLSETETEAIDSGAWWRLEEAQTAKGLLQTRIAAAEHLWNQECPADDPARPAQEAALRAIVHELVGLEHRNIELLERERSAAEHRQSELDSAAGQLRQVHRAYAAPPLPAWQSYS